MKTVSKLFTKLVGLALFLFLVSLVWANHSSQPFEKSLDGRLSASGVPRRLFVSNCARCHGADGKSRTALGKLYEAPDISGGRLKKWSSKSLTAIIRNGKRSMPGFGKKLNKAQLTALIGYVRTL